jgi:hypothetical protein
MIAIGRIKPGSTLYIPFDSFAGSTGASITITGFALADIKVYKDGSTTERASTSGYALLDTDGIDFDGITGIHGFSIDTSDNTTADFWACGARYFVVISTITVDGQTVSFLAASFNIGYDTAILNTFIATLATQVSFTINTGPAEDNALTGCLVVLHDQASAVQQANGLVIAYVGATKTVTLFAAPTFTITAKDNIAFMPPALVPATPGRVVVVDAAGLVDANAVKLGPTGAGTAQTARDVGASVLLSSGTGTGQAKLTAGYISPNWGDVGNPTTALALTGTTIATTQKVDIETIKTNPVVNAGTVTFPTTATLASTTNVTAGTITTVTNLTNAPTAGDLTATMKTSVTTAATAATPIAASVAGAVGSVAAGGITAATFAAGAIDAAAIATDAIGSAELAASAITEIQAGLSTLAAADVWAAATRTLTAGTNIVLAKGVGLTGLNDLSAAQVNAEADTALIDVGVTTTITGRIDVAIGTRLASAGYTVPPTVGAIADQVFDEILSDHLGANTTGAALNAAGSAGDPWITALPGAYSAGQAGRIVGDTLNATVGSRATAASVGELPTNTFLTTSLADADDAVLAAIAALNNLSAAGVRTAVGLAVANLDIQLADLPTNAELATALVTADDAVLAAIAALNNLSSAGAQAAAAAALTAYNAAVTGAAMTLTSGERNAAAIALLTMTSTMFEDTAPPKSFGTAVMKAVHRTRDNNGILEIYKADGTTLHASQTLGTDPGNEPIDSLTGAV